MELKEQVEILSELFTPVSRPSLSQWKEWQMAVLKSLERLAEYDAAENVQIEMPIFNLEALEAERTAWSRKTFPEATAMGCLEHARMEITEIEEALRQGLPVAVEYADAIMLLLDSAARAGIDCRQVLQAYKDKIEVNKARQWRYVGQGRYEHVEPREEIGPVRELRELMVRYPDMGPGAWTAMVWGIRGNGGR